MTNTKYGLLQMAKKWAFIYTLCLRMMKKTLGVATKNLIIAMNKIAQLSNYEKRSIKLEK